ncbi:MAG: GNAT family N-acetyltransferase [Alphaproteobacteria bacterium]|nr:GNAT family N-acetyltransferase [Alphaproteobacteria bacterium]
MIASALPIELSTERLRLVRPRTVDGPALGEALLEAMPTLEPWFQWARPLARWGTPEDLAIRARVLEHRNEEGLDRSWLMWEGDRVLGEVTLRLEGFDFDVLGFHVWLRPSVAGRGLAREASDAALDAASTVAQWVEAECGFANYRSRALLRRLGFERFGSTRDHERYVIHVAERSPAGR